jgi:hypothetical protein
MQPISLGDRLRPFALFVVRAFFLTWLAVTAGGIALAIASGYLMPNVGPVVRTLLQVFFALQFITVGFFMASRCAMSAALIGGVRRLQLGKMALNLLMSRVSASDDENRGSEEDIIDSSTSRLPATREMSATIAAERLRRVMAIASVMGGARGGGIFRWLRGALVGCVGEIMLSRFRARGRQNEQINLAAVERELENQVDGLLLTRLRYTLLTWSVLVVAVLIAEVVAIAFIANWLAS